MFDCAVSQGPVAFIWCVLGEDVGLFFVKWSRLTYVVLGISRRVSGMLSCRLSCLCLDSHRSAMKFPVACAISGQSPASFSGWSDSRVRRSWWVVSPSQLGDRCGREARWSSLTELRAGHRKRKCSIESGHWGHSWHCRGQVPR